MSKRIFYNQSSGDFRAVAINATGQRWDENTDSAWESHNDGDWSDYLITGTQLGTSTLYYYDVPNDAVLVEIFSGAAPVVTDLPVAVYNDLTTRQAIR